MRKLPEHKIAIYLRKYFFLIIVLGFPYFLCAQQVSVIPQPVSMEYTKGNFLLNEHTALVFDKKNAELQAASLFFL